MIIDKIFTTRLIIKDPNITYALNLDEILLNKLRNKFNNKTFKSSLILNVIKIIQRSLIRRGNDLNSNSYIDIIFLAESLIYLKNEVITDCKIIRKEERNTYYCSSKYAKIELQYDSFLNALNSDNYIPAKIIEVKYGYFSDNIKVLAKVFKPEKEEEHYFLVKPEDNTLIDSVISSSLKQLKYVKDKLNKIINDNNENKSKYKSITNMIFPIKDNKSIKTLINNKIDINIDEFLKQKSLTAYIKPQSISQEENYCFYSSDNKIISDIINNKKFNFINSSDLIEYFVNNKIIFLSNVISFMTTFKTLQDIKKNNNYFKLYIHNKI